MIRLDCFGLLYNMSDDEISSACSAITISGFPLSLNPTTMDEIRELLDR